MLAAASLLLSVPAWAAPPVALDRAWGETLFYYFQDDYIPAITRLGIARTRGELSHHAGEAELVLGGMYLGYGLHRRAEDVFESLLATHPKPEVRNQAWYFLAQVKFIQGFPEEAVQALSRVEGRLPGTLQSERVDLEARALMASGRAAEAAELLAAADLSGGWRYYGLYNQGVAFIRAGQPARGDAVLERLGASKVVGPELLSLKDRANLALGSLRMTAGDSPGARLAFDRVRLDSPYATRALLGAGWVDSGRGDYQAALGPWTELGARDPLDAAVQESLIAIPFAYAQLGAPGRAVGRYEFAVASFEGELDRLDRAVAAVHAGRLTAGLEARPDDLPDGDDPLAHYLYVLMAGDDFQRGTRALEDLGALDRLVGRWQGSIVAFRDMLTAQRRRFQQSREPVYSALDEQRLGDLRLRHEDLSARLATVRADDDVLALADSNEHEAIRRIQALEAVAATDPEARERLRRLRGVIYWQASAGFPARLRAMEKSLAQSGKALQASSGLVGQIKDADVLAPAGFESFEDRIAAAAGRLDSLQQRLRLASAAQTEHLEHLAVVELQARRERVSAYLSQARYALAASYDHAALAEAAR